MIILHESDLMNDSNDSGTSLDFDDDIRSGRRSISLYYQLQSLSALTSPGRSDYTIILYSLLPKTVFIGSFESLAGSYWVVCALSTIYVDPTVLQKVEGALANDSLSDAVFDQLLTCLKEEWME